MRQLFNFLFKTTLQLVAILELNLHVAGFIILPKDKNVSQTMPPFDKYEFKSQCPNVYLYSDSYSSAAVVPQTPVWLNPYPKDLHVVIYLGLQEANLLVALCVSKWVKYFYIKCKNTL